MPRFLRIFLTAFGFTMFFLGTLVLGLVLFPVLFLLALGNTERHRDRCTRFVSVGYGTFIFFMRLMGLASVGPKVVLPPELEGKPYVMVANHPTLIDVLFLLHWCRGLTSVVKYEWYRNFFFGPALRSTHYISGPSAEESRRGLESPALERMKAHVRGGHPLIMFPEGTRSKLDRLNRMRRGPFQIAKECGVPLVRVFIAVDRPMLMKGVPFWRVPDQRAHWEFEVLDIIDTETDPRSAEELRKDSSDEYRRRFGRWLEERDRQAAAADAVPATHG